MAIIFSLQILLLNFIFALTAYAQVQTPPNSTILSGFVRFQTVTKQVSWFYAQNDLVVVDGDVIFGTATEFSNALVNVTYNSSSPQNIGRRDVPLMSARDKRSLSLFPGSPGLWPGGTVYYRYFDSNTESLLSTYVNGAINNWVTAVPCLKFVQLPNDNNPNGANGIVTIEAHNPNVGYCLASMIGYGSNALFMQLDTGGGCGIPEVTHEFGHVLGLYHEQQRPDAITFDPLVCQNLIDYPWAPLTPAQADVMCCPKPVNGFACCGWACQFAAVLSADDAGPFDFQSIMLYRDDAFAKPGTFTLPNGPNLHSNPQQLSQGDIDRISLLYGCPAPQCNPGCNPSPGANTCSIPTAEDCVYPSLSVPNPRAACACRAGYKATAPGILDTDTTKQWRLPADEGNFRVWVAQGVACDTLCDQPFGAFSCQEVSELPAACLHN